MPEENIIINNTDIHLMPLWIPQNVKISFEFGGVVFVDKDGNRVLLSEFSYDGEHVIPLKSSPATVVSEKPKVSPDDCAQMKQIKDNFICKHSGLTCELIRGNTCKWKVKNVKLNCQENVDSSKEE